MRTVKRAVVASALAFPLTLGTAGIASADASFGENGSFAGADGAGSYSVSSQADGHVRADGDGTSFEESSSFAGPDGAWTEYVSAHADGDGDTSFEQGSSSATSEGASSENVSSSAGGDVHIEGSEDEQGLLGGLIGL
ncbi:hypothetical protein [Amycolatopsis palatopharyngis]|uniref:hypothetical protein n=1 Tax=Amycolatopsis palatopharyngis TaxID=187982 RepID=UPI001B86A673|nr:hypothetical protein [Amycolatopsis palatopharyngis]